MMAFARNDAVQVERIDDSDEQGALVGLRKPRSKPFRLAVELIEKDATAPRQKSPRRKDGEDDHEQSDVGNLEYPQECFVCGNDATVVRQAIGRLRA